MAFQPGQSGNPNGYAKIRRFQSALDRAIAQDDSKLLREAAEKLLKEAANGQPWAVQMLADRLDGKVPQAMEHSGPEGGSIVVQIQSADAEA